MTVGEDILDCLKQFNADQAAATARQVTAQQAVLQYLSGVLKPIWDKYPDLDAVVVRATPTRKRFTRPHPLLEPESFDAWRCLRANVTRHVSDSVFTLCPGWLVVKRADCKIRD